MGELLRSTRHTRNISISQVAAATRIKPVFLQALEEGEYGLLPGPAYVTGFLRNYAQYLGLHPDDVVQDFYAYTPAPQPTVKPATRVLASVHERRSRSRILWMLAAVVFLLAAGYAIKLYNEAYSKGYATPLRLTPQNVGANIAKRSPPRAGRTVARVSLKLRAFSPVWVRVTVDGRRVYQGLLRRGGRRWSARQSIFVMTYDGSRLEATQKGRRPSTLATRPGLGVWSVTASGWKRIS